MRIFVFELVTAGGMPEAAPSLVREGDLMLHALLRDLCALPGHRCLIARDAALPPPSLPLDCRWVRTPCELALVWAHCLDAADAVWPIVPERDGALERIGTAVLAAGKILLGSAPDTVRIAASKLQTTRRLESCGVATVPGFGCRDRLPDIPGPWVLKPDDGIGCQGLRVFPDRERLRRHWERLADAASQVAQPFVAGTPGSLSLLARDGEARLLAVNRQRIVPRDGGLALLGCTVNGLQRPDGRYRRLARAVAAALPGLWGYAGVDLIATPAGALALEVNPRLTTSYVGLRDSLGINPAGLVLDLLSGAPLPAEPPAGRAVKVDLEDGMEDGDAD